MFFLLFASKLKNKNVPSSPSLQILPLQVDSLRFEINNKVLLDDISFQLLPGAPTGIVGPNGAGKSLLLRLCHGLLTPSAGSIEWASGSAEQQRAAQAMVFQRPILLRRSVRGNIEHALKARHIEKHERADRTEIVLQKTGLHNISNRNARVLSGGEQQRLALARAWALKPRVLFLDEPTANLDPAATAQVEQIIQEMDQDQVRIMMVSHDLGQVRRVAVDVMFLHNGRLIEHSPAEHFFKTPETSLSTAFINGELLW